MANKNQENNENTLPVDSSKQSIPSKDKKKTNNKEETLLDIFWKILEDLIKAIKDLIKQFLERGLLLDDKFLEDPKNREILTEEANELLQKAGDYLGSVLQIPGVPEMMNAHFESNPEVKKFVTNVLNEPQNKATRELVANNATLKHLVSPTNNLAASANTQQPKATNVNIATATEALSQDVPNSDVQGANQTTEQTTDDKATLK